MVATTPTATPDAAVHHLDDPDLNHAARPKLLSIDWATVHVTTDAEALALWNQIAPTGSDWEAKVDEIPEGDITRALAVALLREGNFTCVRPAPPPRPSDCPALAIEVPDAAPTSTLADPCLRRSLAEWSLVEIEAADLPQVRDAVRAIVAIPPPESQLVAAALSKGVAETDFDTRLELLGIAMRAGQHDVVNGALADLDERHLIDAVLKHHIPGALEVLSAEANRAVYLAAVTDEQLAASARTQAMTDLAATADVLAPDVHKALVAATRSPDCAAAAGAARTLDQHGDHAFVPKRPRTSKPDVLMHALCVLASYELQQRADEASLFASYIPAKGYELSNVSYNEYSDTDPDGDGDVHTEHSIQLVGRDVAVVPEIEDLVRAMHRCAGTTCRSQDREFRFTFKSSDGLIVSRLEVVELPPCKKPSIPVP